MIADVNVNVDQVDLEILATSSCNGYLFEKSADIKCKYGKILQGANYVKDHGDFT